jgi:DUF4097 and DUF4098 domain-containing protein YvlB
MRRGSLIAPLLLILIGVVFLVKNIRPEWPLLDTLFAYWPFLLIGWGLLRILEILVWHFRGRPLPVAGISGGEWFLVVLLTIVGSTVWGVQHIARDGFGRIRIGGVEMFGESYDYPLETRTQKAGKTPRLVVDNLRGAARILGADSEEVKVTGRTVVRAMSKADADRAQAGVKVKLSAAGDIITLSLEGENLESARVTEDLEITVPRATLLECRGRTADFDISDLNGPVSVTGEKSGVRLQNIGGRVSIDTRASDIIRAIDVRGDMDLKGRGRDIELENVQGQVTISGSYSGETSLRKIAKPVRFESSVTDLRMEQIPGEVTLALTTLTGNDIVGPLTLRTRTQTKDVQLSNVADSVSIDVERGDVELRQGKLPLGRVDVTVRSGNIDLALPAAAKFTLDAATDRGEVSNEFDPKLKTEENNRGAKLTGSLGPGPEIRLKTSRGSVTLTKVTGGEWTTNEPSAAPRTPKAPVPPAPPRADNQ